MKKIFLTLISVFITLIVNSQDVDIIDIVTMKDSTVYKGAIIYTYNNRNIKLRNDRGKTKKLKFTEISYIRQETENINLSEYGGGFSYGIALFGGGVIGVPVRFYMGEMVAFEVGAYIRPLYGYNDKSIDASLMLAGGYNFFLSKSFNIEKRKVNLDGISLKGGYSLGLIPEAFITLGYANECFRKNSKKKSIITEIGGGIMKIVTDENYYYSLSNKRSKQQPILYLKINWNWY